MAGLSRAPLFLLALALALALTASPAAGASADRPRLVGGLAEADVNEEGVQQALNFALSEYNKASNDAFHSRAMRVVRARKQVRSGVGGWEDRGAEGPGVGGRGGREAGGQGEAMGRRSLRPGRRGPCDAIIPAPSAQLAGHPPPVPPRPAVSLVFLATRRPSRASSPGLAVGRGHSGSVPGLRLCFQAPAPQGQGLRSSPLSPHQAMGLGSQSELAS